jgi:hypothetical protein
MAYMLQSLNFPKLYIRHQNFEAELMGLDSPGFREDFAWELRSRGRDDAGATLWAFESVNRRGYFLRHKNFRVFLEKDDSSAQFERDSTFRRRNSLAGDPELGWRSWEAINWDGHFIRHRDFHVYLQKDDGGTFSRDTAFRRVEFE